MAPRNSDANTSYKKNFPVEDSDVSVKDIVPCLLHKKHKVVKLVKTQMQKIQQEGLLCNTSGLELVDDEPQQTQQTERALQMQQLRREGSGGAMEECTPHGTAFACWSFLMLLMALFLLMFLMVWISAGPLSNSIAHTPIPFSSFVRTEGHCSLEKKYLLRWSKPEYLE